MAKGTKEQAPGLDPAQAQDSARAAYSGLVLAARAAEAAALALTDEAQAQVDPAGQDSRAQAAVEAAEDLLAAAEQAAQAQQAAAKAAAARKAASEQAADPDPA